MPIEWDNGVGQKYIRSQIQYVSKENPIKDI